MGPDGAAGAGVRLHVGQMRAQHAEVAARLREIEPLRLAWRTTADPVQGETLAASYERMLDLLRVHLRREVVELVPVAKKVITQAEWDATAKHSMDAIPKSRLLAQLGGLLAMSSPEERAALTTAMPRPDRLLYLWVGRRQFERQFRELFPGRPIPQTL